MNPVNLFAISALVNGIVSITFGLLVISKNWRDRMNQIFFLMTVFLAIWSFSYWQWQLATSYDTALLWVKLLSIGSLFIPIFFYNCVIKLINEESLLNRVVLWSCYITSFCILFFVNSNLYISGLENKSFFQFWPSSGVVYDIYFCYIYFGLILYTVYILFRTYFITKDRDKKGQLLYIIISCVLGFGGVITDFPLWWDINIPPYGNFLAAVFPLLLGYSILKYKLFNVRAIVSEILVFFISIVLLIEAILSVSVLEAVVKFSVFIIVSIFGYILIRSVYREISQREKIEKLATDLQKANDRLLELDRQKSEFVSFATHQLRAPLTAMKGYASLILEGDLGAISDQLRQAISRIFESSKTLANIVDDYLNLTRIELGTMKYAFDTVDLKTVVEDVIGELGPNIKKDGLEFTFKAEDMGDQWDWRVTADRDKLKQVIANLVDNSIKYTLQGWVHVTLSFDRPKHKFLFRVEDNGIGIASETLPLLFNKFSRAGNANKTNIKGTGLGLFVAKQIIDSHHGAIYATSPGEGKGSTFTVELEPFAKA